VTARLRQEELNRGLNFDYCLNAAGTAVGHLTRDTALETVQAALAALAALESEMGRRGNATKTATTA
jgi:hypothetical protein